MDEEIKEAMNLVRSQLKVAFSILNEKEIAEAIAKGIKNVYDALIAEGFTPDQAIQILIMVNKK